MEKNNRDFIFITLNPINYQVLENQDVFELIKRDVLFQITIAEMLSDDIEISDEAALLFYVQSNCMSLLEIFLSYISKLNSTPKVAKGVMAALTTNKLLRSLKEKVLEKKKRYKSTEVLEDFWENTNSIPILEEDIITKIIQDSIDDYKKKHREKRIVLLIEDMDRLDPAHLFRILNVFSAHLDTEEKYFVESNGEYFYNKFHFDNIVFVMDYENTRKIFEHFYGKNTNFEGYIQKFVSKGFFEYSLEEERYKYIQAKIVELTGLPDKYVEAVISKDELSTKNLRIIVDSFDDIDSQIKERPIYNNKQIHLGILRLYVILKRIGLEENYLVSAYRNSYKEIGAEIIPYIIGYLAIMFAKKSPVFKCYGVNDENVQYKMETGVYDSETQLFNNNTIIECSADSNTVISNRFDDLPIVLKRFAAI